VRFASGNVSIREGCRGNSRRSFIGRWEFLCYQLPERGPPGALLNDEYKVQMNQNFYSLLLMWATSGVCLVLLMRRHRLRLEAGFVW
jgi:hypothetical protein